jgi:repressor of nif and glnA expression
MNKTLHAILSILDRCTTVTGSRELARQLTRHGVELTERTVRYYLKRLDSQGFTEVFGKEGRKITARGREELRHALVSDKTGIVIIGGLNPVAVLEENGIATESKAMSTLFEYSRLVPFKDVLGGAVN